MTQDEEWGIGEVCPISFSRSPTHLTESMVTMAKNKPSAVWDCDVHHSNSSPSVANFFTWPQVGRGEAWVLCAFFTGQGSDLLQVIFILFSRPWSYPPLWESPEGSWCLTNLSGIQQGESASLGKVQRKPLPHINTGPGPSIDLSVDPSNDQRISLFRRAPKSFCCWPPRFIYI
jgi:hypothetical protein